MPGRGPQVCRGLFPWVANARSLALGCDEGLTKRMFDLETHRVGAPSSSAPMPAI